MRIDDSLPPTSTGRKRWSRDDCKFLENAGLLKDRYELLDGEIVVKTGQSAPHAQAVTRVIVYLLSLFGRDRVQAQATMEVPPDDRPTNRPEPDVIAFRRASVTRFPTGDEVLLAVEIAEARSLADDFGAKVRLYARAGCQEYWVLDLTRRLLFAFQHPEGDEWGTRAEYAEGETVAPLSAPQAIVPITELLPPKETSS